MNCKECKFWNKKKVISPAKHGFCENPESKEKYQMVLPENDSCKCHRAKRNAKTTLLSV